MITTQRHDLGLSAQSRDSVSLTQFLQGLRHLLPCDLIVKRGDGNISTVYDLGPVLVRVDVGSWVEPPKGCLSR